MTINTNTLIPMTEANQNFSKVVRSVDETGMAVILKNNKPRYVVVGFDEYDEIQAMREERRKRIIATANSVVDEHIEAFKELAK